jgi:hypothetical protein
MPPELAPFSADRHQHVGYVKLPQRLDDTEQRDAAGERARTEQHHALRPEPCDGVADEHHHGGGQKVEARNAGRDHRRRPAVQPVELGEIDAVAVEPEAPAAHRGEKARDDHAPAGIADRGFVDSLRCRLDCSHAVIILIGCCFHQRHVSKPGKSIGLMPVIAILDTGTLTAIHTSGILKL